MNKMGLLEKGFNEKNQNDIDYASLYPDWFVNGEVRPPKPKDNEFNVNID